MVTRLKEWFHTLSMRPLWKSALWLGPLLLLFEIALRPVSEPDLFFYLAIVEQFFKTGSWPVTDPFLITEGETLYSFHQWLGYFLFYGPYQIFGWFGPQLVKIFLLGALFALPLWCFFRVARPFATYDRSAILKKTWPVPPAAFAFLFAAVIFSSHHRFRERVSLWGDLFTEILVAGLLFWREKAWFWRLLPLLFLAWAQIHPSYPLGFAILLLFFAFDSSFVITQKRWPWILAAFTAPLLNPLGLDGYLYPFRFALETEPYLTKHVMEWLPLWDIRIRPFLFVYLPFFTLLPYLIYLIVPFVRERRLGKHLFAFVLLSMVTALMVKSVRFGMSGQLVMLLLLVYFYKNQNEPKVESKWLWPASLVGVLAILLLKVGSSHWLTRPIGDRFGLDKYEVPVSAAAELKRLNPRMPIFNSFKYGGYLAFVWAGNPKIFYHGFSTNFKFFEDNYLAPQDSPQALKSLIKRFDFGVFILSKFANDMDYIDYLSKDPDWQLIWQDQESVIFVLRDPRVFGGL